jgi:PAS domain S-box-containing protein
LDSYPAWIEFFNPQPEVQGFAARRTAWLLALLLAVITPLTALTVLGMLVSGKNPFPALTATALIYMAQQLSRTRFYRLGGIIALVTLMGLPLATVFTSGSLSLPIALEMVEWLTLALTVAYVVFEWRGILLVLGLSAAGLLLLPAVWPATISLNDILSTLKLLFSIAALLIAIALMALRGTLERLRAEAQLRISEERYRHISEMMSDFAFTTRVDPDGKREIEWIIGAVNSITGLSIDDLKHGKLRSLIHPDDQPLVEEREAQLKRGGQNLTEVRIITSTGHLRWLRLYSEGILENGRLTRIYGAIDDITNEKRIAADAAERARLNEAITNTIAAISATLDLDEVLDRILGEVLTALPHKAGNILLVENGVAWAVRARGFAERGLEAALRSERYVISEFENLRLMTETGQPHIIGDTHVAPGWVNTESSQWIRSVIGVPIRLDGQTLGFLNLVSDKPNTFDEHVAAPLRLFADQAAIAIRNARLYDEVRRYADQLEALVDERTRELDLERRRMQIILDGTGEGIFYTEDDRIQYANPALCKLAGYAQDELIGQSRKILRDSTQSDETRGAALQTITRGEVWRNEVKLRRKDGTLLEVGMTLSVIGQGEDGKLRTVVIVRDISREKALQVQRTNLIAHASHELRTPITNLKTRLYLLRRQPERLEAHLQVLEEVADRMRRLIADLLDMSRLEHGLIPVHLKPTSLTELVRSAVQVQQAEAERKNQRLSFEMPDRSLVVNADTDRLTQVFTNLLTNAINYTGEGGSITVSIQPHDQNVSILVEDTGMGIEPEQLELIFEPFYRAIGKGEGTGLGLTIARQIVTLHHGNLRVESTLGRGSRFTVTLPLLPSEGDLTNETTG